MVRTDKQLLFERMNIIGGMPIHENLQTWKNNIGVIRNEFKQNLSTVTNTYFHGTPSHNVIKIMVNSPELYYHRELGIDRFSVLTNDNMIRHFGGQNGFEFFNVTLNVVLLPEMYYYLMASDTGMGSEQGIDDADSDFYKKALSLGFMNRFNELGIDNQEDFIRNVLYDPTLSQVDGFKIFEDERGGNNEDETALLESGLKKAFSSETYVVYEGTEYSTNEFKEYMKQNPDEVKEALNTEEEY